MFDTGRVRASPSNSERPAHVPLNPMGALPCVARLEDAHGTSWWVPAIANRWTSTHVLVLWRPDPRQPRSERPVWLRKADVRPWLRDDAQDSQKRQ